MTSSRAGVLVCEACGAVDRRGSLPRRVRSGLQLVRDISPALQRLEAVDRVHDERLVALEGLLESAALFPAGDAARIREQLAKLERELRDLRELAVELDRAKCGVDDMRHVNRKVDELRSLVGAYEELQRIRPGLSLALAIIELDQKAEEIRATALSALESAELARTGHGTKSSRRSRSASSRGSR